MNNVNGCDMLSLALIFQRILIKNIGLINLRCSHHTSIKTNQIKSQSISLPRSHRCYPANTMFYIISSIGVAFTYE